MGKEEEIAKNMKTLDISREEAEQLWEDDQSGFETEEMAEMAKKAKEVTRTIHDARTFERRPKVERVRKENPTKREIIYKIQDLLVAEYGNAELVNVEKYISFKIGDEEYEINLIQKRKKKA